LAETSHLTIIQLSTANFTCFEAGRHTRRGSRTSVTW